MSKRPGIAQALRSPAFSAGLRLIFAIVIGVITLMWLVVETTRPALEAVISAERIQHVDGYRYQTAMKNVTGWRQLLVLPSDSASAPNRSNLLLFEDGRQIGPPHQGHADIMQQGQGRYSHWVGALVFSASDNTDPRTNGRSYTVRGVLVPPLLLRVAGIAGLLIGLYLLAGRLAPKINFGWVKRALPLLFCASNDENWPKWGVALGTAVFFFLGVGVYWTLLTKGVSSGNYIGAYFPISDASGYWGCANEMLEFGQTDYWCHRRPLYSMFLAGVTLLAGRDLQAVLFLQAGILAACIFFFAREVARWLGFVAAAIAAYVLFLVAHAMAFGTTMSEVLGLCLGLLAGAALLRAGEQRSLRLALFGLFVFGLGQFARPGAMFALPLILAWVATLNGFALRNVLKSAALGIVALFAGFVLHASYVGITGGDPTTSFGNTPTTIYGLSVGKDWMALQRDHPELTAENASNTREVYRIAFENIRADPRPAIHAVIENLKSHLDNQWVRLAMPELPGRVMFVVTWLFAAYMGLRSPRAALAAAVTLGELASSALTENDAGMRLWAASGPIAQLLPVLLLLVSGVRWLLRQFAVAAPWEDSAPAFTRLPVSILAPVGAVIALLLLPLGNLPFANRQPPVSAADRCSVGQDVFRIDIRTAADMTISEAVLEPQAFPRRVSRDDLPFNYTMDTLYGASVRSLDEVRLLRVVPEAPRSVALLGFYAPASTQFPEGPAIICVDPKQPLDVAYFNFQRIVSVRAAN